MLSLSTVFCVNRFQKWKDALDYVKNLGFESIELNVEVPASWIAEIIKSVEAGHIIVSSLHNYCPKLEQVPYGRTIYSAYSYTSLNEDERRAAVELTRKTVDYAKLLGAKAVVVHPGEVKTDPSGVDLYKYIIKFGRHGKLYESYVESIKNERAAKQKIYFDVLLKTLDEVLVYAEKNNIRIGLENRFYYHEIPLAEEMIQLLEMFKGSMLGYWHDSGHAEMLSKFGMIENQETYLKPLGDNLIGFHLHDLKDFRDHYAPGSGSIDFSVFKKYMREDILKVIEAHPHSTEKEVKESIGFLKNLGT